MSKKQSMYVAAIKCKIQRIPFYPRIVDKGTVVRIRQTMNRINRIQILKILPDLPCLIPYTTTSPVPARGGGLDVNVCIQTLDCWQDNIIPGIWYSREQGGRGGGGLDVNPEGDLYTNPGLCWRDSVGPDLWSGCRTAVCLRPPQTSRTPAHSVGYASWSHR